MPEPAYVAIAGEYARLIRSGELRPSSQLPSYAEIAQRHGVSNIVVRKALELLQNQGLVRSVRRRGIFVADRPALVRVSPERQMQSPEETFTGESAGEIDVERKVKRTRVSGELAEAFGLASGSEVTHVLTRATEDGRPISISDSYQPVGVSGISEARTLEETVADRMPGPAHAEWLGTAPGDLIKQVHQRFFAEDGRLIMLCEVSYPRDRYDAFTFRMTLGGKSGDGIA